MHVCTFSADEEVTGGSVNVSVVYNNILPFYKGTFDLCELVQDTKKSCPVPKGIFDITVGTKVPKGVPAVSIGKKWFCLFTCKCLLIYANSDSKPNKSHCSNHTSLGQLQWACYCNRSE